MPACSPESTIDKPSNTSKNFPDGSRAEFI
jgi:hypothetical protein